MIETINDVPNGILTAFAGAVRERAHAILLDGDPSLSWDEIVEQAIADAPTFDWGGDSMGDGWQRISGYQVPDKDMSRFRAILAAVLA